MDRPRLPPAVVLSLGLCAVGTGGVLARLADAPATAISFWRCAIAAVVIAAIRPGVRVAELRQLTRQQAAWGLFSGFWLAVHFLTWIQSLESTTVAASVVLVNTSPIWVGLLTPLLTRERVRPWLAIGIALAFTGSAVLALCGDEERPAAMTGNALALAGGLSAALYLLAGRRVRGQLSLGTYTIVAYGTAAMFLGLAAAWEGTLAGYDRETWLWLAACGVVPQLIGHTSFNWALRWLPAAVVSVTLLGEPLVAATLAWWVLGEAPGPAVLQGGTLILAGIFCATRASTSRLSGAR